MSLTVLSVAYPLAPVGPDAAGGAEQILHELDAGLARSGHRPVMIACEGSHCAGTLLSLPPPPRKLDETVRQAAHAACRRRIAEALARWPIDLIHMHGLDFEAYLPPASVPTLITLHLPPSWYAPSAFRLQRPQTRLNCVSAAQHRACPPAAALLPPVPNGIPVETYAMPHAKRNFVLALGRICPEKGHHIALEAARRAGKPMLLAGKVFGYPEHQRYFREEIVPRLDDRRHFLGPVGVRRKRRLLAAARCVLLPSLAPETSSLVAMEALASGTPVIAFPSGALREIVEDGSTGFLVRDEQEMAEAIPAVSTLSPQKCREAARYRFSAGRMVARYLALYHALAHNRTATPKP